MIGGRIPSDSPVLHDRRNLGHLSVARELSHDCSEYRIGNRCAAHAGYRTLTEAPAISWSWSPHQPGLPDIEEAFHAMAR